MTKRALFLSIAITATALFHQAFAQSNETVFSTPPLTAAEREAIYNSSIEKRAGDILRTLALNDAAKETRVHDIIIAQYRSLRARDESLENLFKDLGKNAPGVESNRAAVLPILSHTLHNQFLAKLGGELNPTQVESVKDKMTYDKVKVTYDAYCQIIPSLNESEKSMILEALKAAREEAMDGGSANEKAAIFQKHKEKINAQLTAGGHDVAKATAEWEANQEQIARTKSESGDKSAPKAN